jgi:glucuronoarabinoxylan endo-1,4-beta-xylanase
MDNMKVMRLLGMMVLCFLAAPLLAAEIAPDWQAPRQTIVGFGGTMGWIHPHESIRDEVADLLFRKLGASVLRVRALGAEVHGERSLEDTNDNLDPFTFDWGWLPVKFTERENAALIVAARKRGVKTFVPTAWSPPGWMKLSGRRIGGGTIDPKMAEEFAELWAAYVIGMKRDFGIEIRRLSIQNEPDVQDGGHATCQVPPDVYAKLLLTVAARMKREKLDVQVLGPDTCYIANLPDYLKAMDAAGAAPGAPALAHMYDGAPTLKSVRQDALRWRTARRAVAESGRPIWFMESANVGAGAPAPGSWSEALLWAQRIHHALVAADAQVVCYWQLYFDKKGETLIYAAKSGARRYEITPKFYTSMNYYRFVRPGMVRVDVRGGRGLLVSAFRAPDGPQRVVVVVNPLIGPVSVQLDTGVSADWQRYETTRTRKCLRAPWPTGPVSLPSQSVTTFLWTDGQAER